MTRYSELRIGGCSGKKLPRMNINFVWVGKTKNSSIKSLLSDYQERIHRWARCKIIEARDLSKEMGLPAAELVAKEADELARHIPERGRLVALDETGTQFTSIDFARWLEFEQNNGAQVMTFVIGGPEGLSAKISGKAHLKLSMGKMTWTHDMCRVLLLEQVYRALCIMHRIPYHKGNQKNKSY
jgi:23S rRNA (pseudouridine1915-N3)-methyltransferase